MRAALCILVGALVLFGSVPVRADIASLEKSVTQMKEIEQRLQNLERGLSRGEIIPRGSDPKDWMFRSTQELRTEYVTTAILTELILAEKNKVEPNIAEAEKQALKLLNLYLSSRRPMTQKALGDIRMRLESARKFRQRLEGRLYNEKQRAKEKQEERQAVGAFGGSWDSYIAAPFRIPIELTLSQSGNSVTGTYRMEGKYTQEGKDVLGTLKGMINKSGHYVFEWKDNFGAFGKGIFRLIKNGTEIEGSFGVGEAEPNRLWNATKRKT